MSSNKEDAGPVSFTEEQLRAFVAEEVRKALADFFIAKIEDTGERRYQLSRVEVAPLPLYTSSQIWFGPEHFNTETRSDPPHD